MIRTWRTREELLHAVVMMAKQGQSQRSTARALGVSRNTVRVLLDEHAHERVVEHSSVSPPPTRAPRPSKLDEFKPRFGELLVRFPNITAQRVFEILKDEGFMGGSTAVKNHMRVVRPPARPTPSLVTPTYDPGQMAESDWSPYDIRFTTGKRAIIQAFSYTLVVSTRKHVELYTSNDLFALMDGHEKAFARFEGCAHQCKYDSQKPVVLRWEGDQPIYNPRFLAFASHYEFRPVAVRRRKPNDKPRVERGFWEVERSFLNGREFRDIDDMRMQLADWLVRIVDHRKRHGSTALERFEKERAALVPLPRHPYDTARVIYRVCSIDGFVVWEGNAYAVPYEHVTDILPVRVTQRELFVYAADLRCVARHELAPRGAYAKVDPNGIHPAPSRQSPIDLDQLKVAFEKMGAQSAEFFRLMSAGPMRSWGSHARRILPLRERYTTDELDKALGHAAEYGALEYGAVERILAAHATPRTLDEYVAEDTARKLAEAVGGARTQPRDLTEYDRLPSTSSAPTDSPETTSCPSKTPPLEAPSPAPITASPSSSSDSSDTSNSSD